MNLAASGVLFPTSITRQVGAASSKVSTCAGRLVSPQALGKAEPPGVAGVPYRDTGSPVQFRSLLTNHFFSVRCVPSMACL